MYTYIFRRPIGVWGSKFNSVRFEIRIEARSEVKRSESDSK